MKTTFHRAGHPSSMIDDSPRIVTKAMRRILAITIRHHTGSAPVIADSNRSPIAGFTASGLLDFAVRIPMRRITNSRPRQALLLPRVKTAICFQVNLTMAVGETVNARPPPIPPMPCSRVFADLVRSAASMIDIAV